MRILVIAVAMTLFVLTMAERLISKAWELTPPPASGISSSKDPSISYSTDLPNWEEWWDAFDAIRADHPNQGITTAGVYRWTAPDLPVLRTIRAVDADGVVQLPFDPVEYALLLSSENWQLDSELYSEDESTLFEGGVGPRNCMAILIHPPPPALGHDFSCNPACTLPPICQSSGENQGFCACSVNPPTTKPSYCNATITQSEVGGLPVFEFLCSGGCGGGSCQFRCYTQGDGTEIFYCGCQ